MKKKKEISALWIIYALLGASIIATWIGCTNLLTIQKGAGHQFENNQDTQVDSTKVELKK